MTTESELIALAGKLRDPEEIWEEACVGREGYCSSYLQDAAKQAIRVAQAEALGVETSDHGLDTCIDDDPAFIAAWRLMEARGYQWSDGNIEKAHLGWLMARASQSRELAALRDEMIIAARRAITDRYYAGGKVRQMTAVKPSELATLVLEAALPLLRARDSEGEEAPTP